MSRHCDGFIQQVFLLLFTLQFTFLLAFSADNPFWCGKVQNEAIDVWIAHNFSMRFHLKDPLLNTQILVLTKRNSAWVKRYNEQCKSDETCAPSRYSMTKVTNITFDLFIDYVDQNDSGHHVVKLYQGKQSLCTALKLNLTVVTPEPICSTRLDKNYGKLQMSCHWVQMNEGDRAHFEVESEVLYEHEIPEMNFQGFVSMTHQFSVNVGLHRLEDEITERSKCVVSHRKGEVKEMCNFPSVTSKSFKQVDYTYNESVEFRCCVRNPDIPIPLLYDGDGQEYPVSFRRNYTSREDNSSFFFLCGAKEDHAVIKIYYTKRVNIRKSEKYGSSTLGISVEDSNFLNNTSREDGQCKILTVNFTYLDSTLNNLDGISTESLVTRKCDSFQATTTVPNAVVTTPWTKNQGILITLAAITASVFAFIVGACITKFYYTYNINSKHHCLVRRDTSADTPREPSAAEDDGGALAMTTFTPKTPQQVDGARSQRLVFHQPPSDEELQCFKGDTIGQCSGPPTLPLRREMMKNDSCGRSDGVKRSNGQQDAPICSAGIPVSNSMYCSVDDVKYMPSKAKHQDSHGKLNQSGLSLSRQKETRDDWKDTYSHTPDLDELYAKPDMSQKTKNKASLESEYDDPRPPENDFFHSILVQDNDPPTHTLNTHHAYHVYGNAVGSPTGQSTSDGELYINTATSALI